MIENDSMSDSHDIDRRYGVDFVAGYDVYRRYYEVNFMVHVMAHPHHMHHKYIK